MTALTLVRHDDTTRAWNGDDNIQMVATAQPSGEWYIEAQQDGDLIVDGYATDEAELMGTVEGLHQHAIEFLADSE